MQPQRGVVAPRLAARPKHLSQTDDGDLGSLGLGREELTLGEAHRPGNEDVREDLQRVVVVEDAGVVMLPRERNLVLGRGQLLLEREDVLVGLQLRVVLDYREERAEGTGQHILGPGLGGRPLSTGGDRACARLGDLRQDALLEVHVALDRVDQVGDQVVAALELDLDLGIGLVDAITLRYETVVDEDQNQDEYYEYSDDDERDHVPPPIEMDRTGACGAVSYTHLRAHETD